MAMAVNSAVVDSGSKDMPYCRKQKSLGLLCSKYVFFVEDYVLVECVRVVVLLS